MPFIADLHIHSRYSRATSKDMNIQALSEWAALKGVDLLGTGDFTHPDWLKELETKLASEEYGLFKHNRTFFILSAEVNNIYYTGEKSRRVHNILLAPTFDVVKEINKMLSSYGSLIEDGRPMLRVSCEEMLKQLFEINEDIVVIPAHAWTPHFSVFGSRSGYDSLDECYGKYADRIYSIETGLSSDPGMNWRISSLDRLCLTSHSDAHSPQKIGREANVFSKKFGYKELVDILKTKDKNKFLYTIEFFPEEGKYHWDGHRECKVCLSPGESKDLNYTCPKCGKRLTVGVMQRAAKLADREEGYILKNSPSFKRLVPLEEIISSALGVGVLSKTVRKEYTSILTRLGQELKILIDIPEKDIRANAPKKIAEGIINVRNNNITISPGYDGEYGKVNVFGKNNIRRGTLQCAPTLFDE